MLKIYDAETAKKTLLKRVPPDEIPVPESILKGIEKIFGEPLTPEEAVKRILRDVRENGDAGLRKWALKLDEYGPENFAIPKDKIQNALQDIPAKEREALELAANRVRQYHEAQPVTSWMTQNMGGTLGQFVRPIHRVGLYIPSGSAPLPSTVIMSAVIAQVAGVKEIALVAPPERGTGKINPFILASAALLGIDEIYAIGGAQAIAALAYGTESIPAVDKICGPGNLFVALAKRQVFGTVGIDSIAGPSEVLIIADESARSDWIAADMLAQAEHDVLASAILLSPSQELINKVAVEVEKQFKQRDRNPILEISLQNQGGAVLTRDLDEAVELANAYAVEHLCLSVEDPWALANKIYAAGAVFLGEQSFEVLGDYVAGPSHVLPTGGSARFSSALNVLDFVHHMSLVALDRETTQEIAPVAATIADAEGLDAHAYAARVRL